MFSKTQRFVRDSVKPARLNKDRQPVFDIGAGRPEGESCDVHDGSNMRLMAPEMVAHDRST